MVYINEKRELPLLALFYLNCPNLNYVWCFAERIPTDVLHHQTRR